MKRSENTNKYRLNNGKRSVSFCILLWIISLVVFLAGCSELEKTKPETFYAETNPPAKQEFRWSNGKMPKSFDPAKASAPPETDIVRAIYDGLTEIEPKTLKAIPAISHKWSSSEDFKTWTFELRPDARWSNGEKVTAKDFVRSWKRLAELGEEVSHHELLKNIVGMKSVKESEQIFKDSDTEVFSLQETTPQELERKNKEIIENLAVDKPEKKNEQLNPENKNDSILNKEEKPKEKVKKKVKDSEFGVKALGTHTLQVSLIKPDREFPELVANPIFRPVFANGEEFKNEGLNADIVTNGAFRIFSVGPDGVTLDRAEHYYNRDRIKLERVRFVPTEDADSALEAYRSGKVDAVTNAQFEPLALKILLPFTDFKKITHSALNFYEFNRKNEPFNDRRVREALAIAIERERLTVDEMEGSTKPAFNFLPFEDKQNREKFNENTEKARKLMIKAGFPDGRDFPKIKLVINRNNIQKRIANAVARMWKENLNVETEIIEKEFDQIENTKKEGGYDVIRRGIVLPTTDETANMMAIFSPKKTPKAVEDKTDATESKAAEKEPGKPANANSNTAVAEKPKNDLMLNTNTTNPSFEDELRIDIGEDDEFILTEEQALLEVPAIPLYFPTSYSLVKPYVQGFEMNTLDAPLLKDVRINNNWQPKKTGGES